LDSPWYPTMRLYRQRRLGDWGELFGRIAEELARRRDDPTRRPPATVEVSPGELIDKITILEIKSERIRQPDKLRNVQLELDLLTTTRNRCLYASDRLTDLTARLKAVNETLWVTEDAIRECERQDEFGDHFVELARRVYKTNDQRAQVKREINDLFQSRLREEKQYATY
jgi:Family of unknown function (DUF6165)